MEHHQPLQQTSSTSTSTTTTTNKTTTEQRLFIPYNSSITALLLDQAQNDDDINATLAFASRCNRKHIDTEGISFRIRKSRFLFL